MLRVQIIKEPHKATASRQPSLHACASTHRVWAARSVPDSAVWFSATRTERSSKPYFELVHSLSSRPRRHRTKIRWIQVCIRLALRRDHHASLMEMLHATTTRHPTLLLQEGLEKRERAGDMHHLFVQEHGHRKLAHSAAERSTMCESNDRVRTLPCFC